MKSFLKQLGAFRTALYGAILMFALLYIGYRLGNYYHHFQQTQIQQQQQRLNELYDLQAKLESKYHMLEVELAVEKMANKKAQQALKQVEDEYYEAKKSLAFYEKIMAPEKQVDGVIVDSFQVIPTNASHIFRFQVTLVQQNKQKRYTKGFVDLIVNGVENNQKKQYQLSTLDKDQMENLTFNFRYFQSLEGEVAFPERFTPESVELVVTFPKTRWQKYNQLKTHYSWHDILANFDVN